jgi:hypothetical protein
MNTGYNNFNTPSLNGLVDITADTISSTSITTNSLTLDNTLNVVEMNFSDNVNGVTTSEFALIPNITNNHIDIVALQDKTQNIVDFDTTQTTFNGLVNVNSLSFDDNINGVDVSNFSNIGAISELINKTENMAKVGSTTLFTSDVVYGYNALYLGLASYEGTIQYNHTFTGFNNSSTSVNVSVPEFESLDGVTSSIQDQLDGKESNSSTGIDVTRLADGTVDNTTFQFVNSLSSNCQTQLNNKESNSSAGINATRLADGTVNNTKFQFINSLSSNCQAQLNGRATLNGSNTFTGSLNTFNNVSINTSLEIEGSAIDFNASLELFSGSIFLYLGLIRGRADGFNYANNSYDTYTGYCYTFNGSAVTAGVVSTVDNILTTITGARRLPPGVYSISGCVIINKGTATYTNMLPIDVNWTCTGGTVPTTINRTYIPSTALNIIATLPTAYFIVTGLGTLRAQYIYDFLTRGTSTVYYDINIVRIA